MSEETPAGFECTPTDPSLEFDLFETVRLRVAGALERRGYDRVEAERVALYLIEASRPVSHFLRVLTRITAPEDEEVVSALGQVIDVLPSLGKARQLLLRIDSEARD